MVSAPSVSFSQRQIVDNSQLSSFLVDMAANHRFNGTLGVWEPKYDSYSWLSVFILVAGGIFLIQFCSQWQPSQWLDMDTYHHSKDGSMVMLVKYLSVRKAPQEKKRFYLGQRTQTFYFYISTRKEKWKKEQSIWNSMRATFIISRTFGGQCSLMLYVVIGLPLMMLFLAQVSDHLPRWSLSSCFVIDRNRGINKRTICDHINFLFFFKYFNYLFPSDWQLDGGWNQNRILKDGL